MMQPLMRSSAKIQPDQLVKRPARLLATGLAFSLVSCTAPVAPYQLGIVPFSESPVWNLSADQIVIKEGPGVTPPNSAVAIRIAEPPTATIRRWVAARLRPDAASRGTITVLIERAEASEKIVQKPKGVTAAFTDNAEAEVKVAFGVVINAMDPSGARTGEVRAEASLISTGKESANENEKRKHLDRMLRDVVARLDAELNNRIRNGLAPFLKQR